MKNHSVFVSIVGWVVALWTVLLIVASQPLDAAHPVQVQYEFGKANEAYREGRYDDAVQRFTQILQQGVENGILYYNLGNALLKSGHKGEALWAYLKAKASLPRDPDVASNLEYAQLLLSQGRAASLKPPRAVRWLTLAHAFSTRELLGVFTVLLWLTAIAWGLWGWWLKTRRIMGRLAWPLTVVAALTLGMLLTQHFGVEAIPRAVVIQATTVTFAPQQGGTTHFELPEGSLVRILQQQSQWLQVQRADGRSGWLPADTARLL
jgi:tetratricopeptide (TPR) repeat protein